MKVRRKLFYRFDSFPVLNNQSTFSKLSTVENVFTNQFEIWIRFQFITIFELDMQDHDEDHKDTYEHEDQGSWL